MLFPPYMKYPLELNALSIWKTNNFFCLSRFKSKNKPCLHVLVSIEQLIWLLINDYFHMENFEEHWVNDLAYFIDKNQQVACVDESKPSSMLPEAECDSKSRPESSGSCADSENQPCPVWSVSEWTEVRSSSNSLLRIFCYANSTFIIVSSVWQLPRRLRRQLPIVPNCILKSWWNR